MFLLISRLQTPHLCWGIEVAQWRLCLCRWRSAVQFWKYVAAAWNWALPFCLLWLLWLTTRPCKMKRKEQFLWFHGCMSALPFSNLKSTLLNARVRVRWTGTLTTWSDLPFITTWTSRTENTMLTCVQRSQACNCGENEDSKLWMFCVARDTQKKVQQKTKYKYLNTNDWYLLKKKKHSIMNE